MAAKHFIHLSVLANFFDTKQLQRGENAVESGHIVQLVPDLNQIPALLRGKVSASMKNKVYDVELHIDKEDGIIAAKCACPRGRVSCHHMAALCIYARDNISVTDIQCSWNVPQKVDESNTKTLADLYLPRRESYVACKTQVSDAAIEKLKESFSTFDNAVGFTWLLSPEPPIRSSWVVTPVEHILYSDEYIKSNNRVEYFERVAVLSDEEIMKIIEATIGQSSNPNWLIIRKHRLIASQFGKVLSASKRNRYPKSLFKSLLNEYNLEGIKAIQWGKENEPLALQYLAEQLAITVLPTGLWLDTCGYLGASPDGLIGTDGIVEAKCPYKFRSSSLKNFIKTDKSCIIYEENGNYIVNKDHNYYHQIQGQLFITKRTFCYLVLWTPTDKIIHKIEKDDEWIININILKDFYLKIFIEYLISQ